MSNNARYKELHMLDHHITQAHICEDDYLHTKEWQRLRQERLKRDNWKCVKCNSAVNVEVHHIRYPDVWGEERLNDLVTLCDDCHGEIHGKSKQR